MSLQIRQTVSFDNACEKNSSLRSSQERKEVNKNVYQSFGCFGLMPDSSLQSSVSEQQY
jgi:hypothetical protein